MSFRLAPAKSVTKIKAFTVIIIISILLSFFGILITLISLDAENILFVDQHFEGFKELQDALGKLQELQIQSSDGLVVQALKVTWSSVERNQWHIVYTFSENNSRFTAENLNRLFASLPDSILNYSDL